MAGETPITVVGNLTADPELRFTPSGAAVANFTVASTPRTFDKQSNEWKDGEALFLNCSVWRQAAENAAESLQRGMRVIVSGRLKARSYETREGEKRTVFEIDVDEVGPSVKYATAKVTKTSRSGGGQGGGGSYGGGGDDPWASGGAAGAGAGAAQGGSGGGQQAGGWGGQQGGGQGGSYGGGQPSNDPWATPGAGGSSEEPPF
ncbi:single-stranded DNA-binding protein [Nocardioides mesophilus]|uniref:Single-stranded DNA-binding protein n=1 Tax=Nocardioides mesophilus TaxID=433659 RepID=A0A7G9RFN8_9ACTN|nr:single-stranded DNA-binding protein [Nocardioides mesophilus]QNN54413.1 single-stranded DNA-binding protein [Nocardioides mesophilus]